MSQLVFLSRGATKLHLAASCLNINITRQLSLSSVNNNKKNFRKFLLGNKRGTKDFKRRRQLGDYPQCPIETDVRPTGYMYGQKYINIPEMIPELIVPDLTDFPLKPYVSYQTPKIVEDPFTAQDLFDIVYSEKVTKDFKEGKILADGRSAEESEEEKQTAELAFMRARQTGCDLFSERTPKFWEFLEKDLDPDFLADKDKNLKY